MSEFLNSFARADAPEVRAEGVVGPQQVKGLHLPRPSLSVSKGATCPGVDAKTNATHGASRRGSFSVQEARKVLRRVESSDDDMLEACRVLRIRGNCDDEWIVSQIEQAIEQSQNMIEVPA